MSKLETLRRSERHGGMSASPALPFSATTSPSGRTTVRTGRR